MTFIALRKAPTDYASKVLPGTRIRLADYDTTAPANVSQDEADAKLRDLLDELGELQNDMFGAAAELRPLPTSTTPASMPFAMLEERRSHSLLIVVQGTDGAGKDGLIRAVLGAALNPLWLRCEGLKAATFDEVGRDFLWRSHRLAPQPGYTAALHRSYYEGVLSERVHDEVPRDVWSARYDQINSFESVLQQANTIVLKFFLHIDKAEQKRRLLARQDAISTAWKLSPVDWQERLLWDEYEEAFEDMLSWCSTGQAPWFIVPADDKWFAHLAVADAIVTALRPYREEWEDVLAEMQRTQMKAIDKVGRN